jgi:alpha-D-xyloside xylohydrolase
MGLISRYGRLVFMLLVLNIAAFSQSNSRLSFQWNEVYPGIWKATLGTPELVSLLTAAANTANVPALQELPESAFPLPEEEIAAVAGDNKIYLRFPLIRSEKLYGLGLNFKTINQRGQILNLHVDHYGGVDNGRTHAPVPFYVSSQGYGVLIDAARYITVYAGTGVRADSKNPPVLYDRNTDKEWDAQPYSDAVEFVIPANGVNVYLFAGPTPMNAVQRYNLMNGGGCLPPKWGLGFTQRVPTLYSQQDIINEVNEFEKHGFPLDFIGLEPGWQSMAYPCTFEWDQKRFPDPDELIQTLKNKGIRTNLWLNPYVSPKSGIYQKVKPLSGSHTVWNGIVPDITMPETQSILRNVFLGSLINQGVGGFKIDEVDGFDNWLWPDVAQFPSGTSAEQMRQIYGLAFQRMTTSWFVESNRRTYGLVRASNAGASSFPYVLYNDYYSHRDFITALINSSYIGVLWTPEVRASKTAEEWVRRMQTVCFSPMAMINAWADGTKPWSFPEVENAVKAVAGLRMQLLPYIYAAFAQYHFEGIPPFRAMNLAAPFSDGSSSKSENPGSAVVKLTMHYDRDFNDQYMMGDNLLIAPLFAGEKSRKVYLPSGKWYDFYTGAFAGENEVIEVSPGIEKIPLFVRNGGIIPMVPFHDHAPEAGAKMVLEIRHYGDAPGSFLLYDDDGESFDYLKGKFSITKIEITKSPGGELRGSMQIPEKGQPFGYTASPEWNFMTR